MVNQFPLTQVPFGSEFVLLREAMHHLLEDSFVPSGGARYRPGPTAPPVPLDVYATPDEAVVLAAVPGMNPQELEITYTQHTLTLAGTLPSAAASAQGQHATWYLRELGSGRFQRSVTLPFEVDADQAAATFAHGIVRITLPKAAGAKPQQIAITAASEQPSDRPAAIEAGSRR